MTKPYAEVIGDPIAHSKSPLIHNFWLKRLGIDAEYRATHVRAEALADYFEQRRHDPKWRGCNVTIPHKQAVQAFVDTCSREASRIGAANFVYVQQDRLIADNSDVDGVLAAIGAIALEGQDVCLIGNGGAARAALQYLQQAAPSRVILIARDPAKALAVAADFTLSADAVAMNEAARAVEGSKLLINATQLGMVGQSPMPGQILDALAGMDAAGVVFDMGYAPLETPLLSAARATSLQTIDGMTMLIGQAASAFRMFFGAPAPREYDDELRDLLIT